MSVYVLILIIVHIGLQIMLNNDFRFFASSWFCLALAYSSANKRYFYAQI